jgi:exonuclease III
MRGIFWNIKGMGKIG